VLDGPFFPNTVYLKDKEMKNMKLMHVAFLLFLILFKTEFWKFRL